MGRLNYVNSFYWNFERNGDGIYQSLASNSKLVKDLNPVIASTVVERFHIFIFVCTPLFVNTNTLFRKIRSCYDVRLAHTGPGAVVPAVYV